MSIGGQMSGDASSRRAAWRCGGALASRTCSTGALQTRSQPALNLFLLYARSHASAATSFAFCSGFCVYTALAVKLELLLMGLMILAPSSRDSSALLLVVDKAERVGGDRL